MRKSEYTNAQLVERFENIVARKTNYPNNKTIGKEYGALLSEMLKRLAVTPEEYEKLREAK